MAHPKAKALEVNLLNLNLAPSVPEQATV
jgi:hypothetical protein